MAYIFTTIFISKLVSVEMGIQNEIQAVWVGTICPLVVIGLTKFPNSRWGKAHPAHPLTASLHFYLILIPFMVLTAFTYTIHMRICIEN